MKLMILLSSLFVSWQSYAGLIDSADIKSDTPPPQLLTNSFKQTLYVFDPDQNAGKPSCNGKCAEVWPPVTLTADEVAALNNPDLAVQARDSGLNQLTFKGRPVYLYHQDRVIGDAKGDGVGGVWHIITL